MFSLDGVSIEVVFNNNSSISNIEQYNNPFVMNTKGCKSTQKGKTKGKSRFIRHFLKKKSK